MTPTRRRQARPRGRRGQADGSVRTVRGRRSEAARQRTANAPSRRKALRRRWVAVLAVLSVLGLVYVLVFTSLVGVRSVEVTGTHRVAKSEVLRLAGVPDRRAMLRVDTDDVEQRLARLPAVRAVDVSRSWPSTITIEVTERTPIAFFRGQGSVSLVDGEGVPFHQQSKTPAKLPELALDKVSARDPITRAVTAVLVGIPDKLRNRVSAVTARTPGSVEFSLKNGKTVRWGDAQQLDRKSKVLAALLSRPGTTYDVSSPELPTVS